MSRRLEDFMDKLVMVVLLFLTVLLVVASSVAVGKYAQCVAHDIMIKDCTAVTADVTIKESGNE